MQLEHLPWGNRKFKMSVSHRRIYKFGMNSQRRQELKQIILGKPKQRKQVKQKKKQESTHRSSFCKGIKNNWAIFSYGFFYFDSPQQRKHTIELLQKGVNYATNKLTPPPMEMIEFRKVSLPRQPHKQLLLLDLDQTLIHSSHASKLAGVRFMAEGRQFNFTVRPFCRHFLKKMALIYEIYVFTAAAKEYAKPIVEYLNQDMDAIKGFLHRQHCLKTKNGLYIKDLRIISGWSLKEMVIVDNTLRSFSLQIENGIPIQAFFGNQQDKVLKKVGKFLQKMAQDHDEIPNYLSKTLSLKSFLSLAQRSTQHPLTQFNEDNL